MTYSLDFRRKVLSVREKEALSMKEVADRFDVGIASVMRWVKNIRPQMTRHKPALKLNMEALAQDVQEHPDSYHHERAERFSVSPTCIRKALKRLGVTYASSIPRRLPRHVQPSRRSSRSIKTKVSPLSLLTRVALPLICQGLTGILNAAKGVGDSMTGERGAELMLLGLC